ncbi:MAG: M23 family metallopeptidase [Bacteroidota bacterium]
MNRFYLWVALLLSGLLACKSVPSQKVNQVTLDIGYEVSNDSLIVHVNNTLACPLRVKAGSEQEEIQAFLGQHFPLVIAAGKDTVFRSPTSLTKEELKIWMRSTFGDPADSLRLEPLSLPFPKGKTYEIVQGYNGSFSHTTDYSRYAIDFNLQVGDTICAAADGEVIGVIEAYTDGGNNRKWRDYANYITIFHPNLNLYTQYVHLVHEGSLVEVGDLVKRGQAIGLCGLTGFTSGVHLHFNVLRATEEGMSSQPVSFEGDIDGHSLLRGQKIKK